MSIYYECFTESYVEIGFHTSHSRLCIMLPEALTWCQQWRVYPIYPMTRLVSYWKYNPFYVSSHDIWKIGDSYDGQEFCCVIYYYILVFTFNHLLTLILQLALEDPKRFRVELTFSRGADLSPLEVMITI